MNGRIGQQFGSYRLLRLIGSGGFAEVYLGEHIHLQTQAAIKIISTPLLQVDQQNYLREARVQVGLKHPHILHLLDCGIEQGLPFLVMDYALHGTLRQRHARGVRVPTQQIISYLSAIAPALQYAHDQNLIHRDLKPENMLIGQNGEVLLSDFGIAIIPSTSKPSVTYDAVGTAVYMAPEQIMGHPVYASDQYALGIVVYEWLVGTPPFQGLLQEITTQHLHALPPPFHQKGVYLQPTVEAIVMKALDKDPMKRFASVQDFALALTSHGQSMSPPTTHTSPSNKGMPSQSILISPPSSSAQITNYPNMTNSPAPPPPPHLAPTYYSPRPSNPPPLVPTQYPPSNPTPLAPTQYPNAPAKTSIRRRSLLAVGCFGTAVLGCGALGYGALSLILRGAATIPPLLTNTSPLLHSTRYTSGSTSSVSSVAWSPDGKMLASGDVAGRINIWSVEPSHNTPVTSYRYPLSNSVNAITWSPDGESIAAGYNDNIIQVWGKSQKISYSDHKGPISNLSWSSEQNLIASVSSGSSTYDYDIHIWDATTGIIRNHCPLSPELKVLSLVWSHKNTPLYLAINVSDANTPDDLHNPKILVWEQNKNHTFFGGPFQLDGPITAIAWKEDDTELLVATGLNIFNDNAKKIFTFSLGAASGVFLSSYPQNNQYSGGVEAVCWKAGVIYAACSDGTLHIEDRNASTSRTYQVKMDGVTQTPNARAWSPDGKYLAYGMNDGSVVVWQMPS